MVYLSCPCTFSRLTLAIDLFQTSNVYWTTDTLDILYAQFCFGRGRAVDCAYSAKAAPGRQQPCYHIDIIPWPESGTPLHYYSLPQASPWRNPFPSAQAAVDVLPVSLHIGQLFLLSIPAQQRKGPRRRGESCELSLPLIFMRCSMDWGSCESALADADAPCRFGAADDKEGCVGAVENRRIAACWPATRHRVQSAQDPVGHCAA